MAINSNSVSNKAIKNYNPKGGGIEFVYDSKTNTFVVGKVKDNSIYGSPHQKLAQAIGADGSSTTVGGVFKRGSKGEIFTTENSGHFGKNWNNELRIDFLETMKSYGIDIIHEVW